MPSFKLMEVTQNIKYDSNSTTTSFTNVIQHIFVLMVAEGDPGSLVKVAHVLLLAASWGMQCWVTFVAGFVMIRGVPRHMFGLVQSKLFPFYGHIVLGFSFLNLAIYAAYHPRELLSSTESVQIGLFFVSLILSALNARWFFPASTNVMFKMQAVEREHGLGAEIGLSANVEGYKRSCGRRTPNTKPCANPSCVTTVSPLSAKACEK
ncbi:unnamed protein product [Ranitomeya imitator]|uniref:Transmembrane protein 205 n=1 Tax=Ranitomeya imitator TaxID=111125 RepID=A0ABN9LIC6_9NEOB|nr:unnamed protein product [Ranitomeya imitator]